MERPTVKEVIENGISYGLQIMGDDFIGFKFVGEGSDFWNGLLLMMYENGNEVVAQMNNEWLGNNGITPLEFDSKIWNQTA